MRRAIRFLQHRLKHVDCSIGSLQNQLQTSTQKAPLLSFSNRFCLYLIQNATRVDSVSLVDVQFGRSKLRSRSPIFVVKENSEFR
jgi:hypothetical protein